NLIPIERASPVRSEEFRGSLKVSQRDPRPSLAMTSVLRIRRRHRLPEGNLGLSKPSCDEKAGAGHFLLLGESVTASAQNVAPVVTTPIGPFPGFAGAPAC